jgi:hypothetical protein
VVGSGGFIDFPSAAFVRDAKSMTTYSSGKWLPVPANWISPNGQDYAYVVNSPNPVVHVVGIATGSDQSFELVMQSTDASAARRAPTAKAVLAFESDGIYLESVVLNSDAAPYGLAVLDPSIGLYTDPSPAGNGTTAFIAVHDRLAYTGDAANGADLIPPLGPNPHWNEIEVVSVDGPVGEIHGGAYIADSWLRIPGFDGGDRPVLSAESRKSYRIFTGALFGSLPSPVYVGKPGDPNNPTGPAVSQGNGMWFGSASGVIWYYPGGGAPFEQVALAPTHPVRVAGKCLP